MRAGTRAALLLALVALQLAGTAQAQDEGAVAAGDRDAGAPPTEDYLGEPEPEPEPEPEEPDSFDRIDDAGLDVAVDATPPPHVPQPRRPAAPLPSERANDGVAEKLRKVRERTRAKMATIMADVEEQQQRRQRRRDGEL